MILLCWVMGRAARRVLPCLSPSPWQGLDRAPLDDTLFLQAIKAEQEFQWLLQRDSSFPHLSVGGQEGGGRCIPLAPEGAGCSTLLFPLSQHPPVHPTRFQRPGRAMPGGGQGSAPPARGTAGVCEPKRCLPRACGRGRRGLLRSGAATAFISVQVLRSQVFDASAAINLMKPMK